MDGASSLHICLHVTQIESCFLPLPKDHQQRRSLGYERNQHSFPSSGAPEAGRREQMDNRLRYFLTLSSPWRLFRASCPVCIGRSVIDSCAVAPRLYPIGRFVSESLPYPNASFTMLTAKITSALADRHHGCHSRSVAFLSGRHQ